jgi:hypothetical protein
MLPLVAAVALLASPASGDDAFWSFLKPGTVLQRCADGSKEQAVADAAWQRIDASIDALADHSDAAPAAAAIRALLETPCFHLAAENGPLDLPTHPTALRRWWEDGGRVWLWSYVHPTEAGDTRDPRSVAILPPSPRAVLFRETTDDPALAPILCAAADATCGTETAGWAERAADALGDARVRRRLWHDDAPPPDPWTVCERDATGPRAYELWRACVGRIDTRVAALPLGRTAAPRDGWLVVTGRRGHYQFCDEAAAYDLATGAAYRADSCSFLDLDKDGSVDQAKTDDARTSRARSGRVSVDNLRETLWMLLLAGRVERVHVRLREYPVPRGVAIQHAVDALPAAVGFEENQTFNTGWTELGWSWIRPGVGLAAEGRFIWNGPGAGGYAGALLGVAEGGFVEGCAPAPLPAVVFPDARVHAGDASPTRLGHTFASLRTALAAQRPVPCAAGTTR